MSTSFDGTVLVVVSVLAVFATISATVLARGRSSAPTKFLAFSTTAAICSVFSSLSYAIAAGMPSVVLVASGDALMLCGPGLIWVAVGILNGRRSWRLAVLIAASAGMFVFSLFVPDPASSLVKFVLLIVFCLVTAIEARRGTAGATRGMLTLTLTLIGYAVYTAARFVVVVVYGIDSEIYANAVGYGSTTGVGVVAVVLVAYSVVSAARDERVASAAEAATMRDRLLEASRSRIAEGTAIAWYRVRVVDLALLRDSFGADYLDDLHLNLLIACRDLAPDSIAVGAVAPCEVVAIVDATTDPGVDRRELRAKLAQSATVVSGVYVPDLDVVRFAIASEAELATAAAHAFG